MTASAGPGWSRWRHVTLYLSLVLGLAWNLPFIVGSKVGIFDWTKDAYYYAFLQASLREYTAIPVSFLFPPESVGFAPALRESLSYWSNPEVMSFTPLLPLLWIMPWFAFVKLQLAIHLALGAWGSWLLGQRLELEPSLGLILFGLCFLNPWLMQHMAIGYVPWMTACLVPWIVAELLARPFRVRSLLVSSLLSALILYQGGLHVFLWLCGTVALFAVFAVVESRNLGKLEVPFWFFTATALLCLPKLVAIQAGYGDFVRVPRSSYASVSDLWGLLTDTTSDLYALPAAYSLHGTNFYDGSLFVGIPYLVLLLACLISSSVRWLRSGVAPVIQLRLLGGAVVLAILGWRDVWAGVAAWAPLLGVERFPWRFLAISLVLLNVLVVRELAHGWRRGRVWQVGIVLAVLLVLWGFQERQQRFLKVATSRVPPFQELSLEEAFSDHLRAARHREGEGELGVLGVRAGLREIVVESPGDPETRTLIQWLSAGIPGLSHLRAFHLENAEVAGAVNGRLLLRALDPGQPIGIVPRSHGRVPLLLLGLCGYGVLMFVRARRGDTPQGP